MVIEHVSVNAGPAVRARGYPRHAAQEESHARSKIASLQGRVPMLQHAK